jgi:hypothetical protein
MVLVADRLHVAASGIRLMAEVALFAAQSGDVIAKTARIGFVQLDVQVGTVVESHGSGISGLPVFPEPEFRVRVLAAQERGNFFQLRLLAIVPF